MVQKTSTQKAPPGLGIDAGLAKRLLHDMVLIRRFEEKAAEAYALGKIGGFLHLYIGEEAVAVGATSVLRPDDYATLAGMIIEELGHIPTPGEHVTVHGWCFEVVDLDGRRIDKVLVRRPGADPDPVV